MRKVIGVIMASIAGIGLVLSGFSEGLGLVFIALKLLEIIDWSWLWVTAPIYGPLIFLIIYLIGMLLLSD